MNCDRRVWLNVTDHAAYENVFNFNLFLSPLCRCFFFAAGYVKILSSCIRLFVFDFAFNELRV